MLIGAGARELRLVACSAKVPVVVRRLPVVQTPASEDADAEARPAWQWVSIGAALLVVLFLPLSTVGLWVGTRLAPEAGAGRGALLSVALPVFCAYAVAALSAGAFVGRFGRRAGPRHRALSGGLGGALILLLAGLGGALTPWTVAFGATVVLIGAGAGFALLGARYGLSRRPERKLGS